MIMQYPISNELKNFSKEKQRIRDKGLPFEKLAPGFSFAIPIAECNIVSLTVQCSKYSKQLGRTFKLYHHNAAGIVEVGRLDGIETVQDKIDSL